MNHDFADECPQDLGCPPRISVYLRASDTNLSTLTAVDLSCSISTLELFQSFDSRFLFSVISIRQHPELLICDLAEYIVPYGRLNSRFSSSFLFVSLPCSDNFAFSSFRFSEELLTDETNKFAVCFRASGGYSADFLQNNLVKRDLLNTVRGALLLAHVLTVAGQMKLNASGFIVLPRTKYSLDPQSEQYRSPLYLLTSPIELRLRFP